MVVGHKLFPVLCLASVLGLSTLSARADTDRDDAEQAAVLINVAMGEIMILGMSAMLAWEHEQNARVYGGVLGTAGAVAMIIPALDDGTPAEFMVPLGLGYLALAHYHWTQAADDSEAKVIRRNFIGLNLTVALAAASVALLMEEESPEDTVSWYLAPNYLGLRYRF